MHKRLDQLLGNLGYCSRREVRYLIRDDRVTVNGQLIRDASMKVDPASVCVDGEALDHPAGILIMMNKPVDYLCTHDDSEGLRIYDLLPYQWLQRDPKVVSVGRLDKDTSGLILVTDQLSLVHRMTSPKSKVEKSYLVDVDQPLNEQLVAQFAAGIALRGEAAACLPAAMEILSERQARVRICEGKYHQVRRMFAACGFQVEKLHRESFGDYALGELAQGEWQELPIPA